MGKKQNLLWTAAVVAALTLFACITINIYFPAEKVESAAEDIVNDIRGNKPPQKKNQSINHEGTAHKIWIAFSPASARPASVYTGWRPGEEPQ